MALLFLWTLISCILFGLAHSHICPGETTDSDDEQMEQTVADSHTTDPRWRLLFGLDAARIYALYTVSSLEFSSVQPLASVSEFLLLHVSSLSYVSYTYTSLSCLL